MGGRGVDEGGGRLSSEEGMWIGEDIDGLDEFNFAQPIGQFEHGGERITVESASKGVQQQLQDVGVNITQQQSIELANAMILSGSLLGGGDLRTKLYRAARLIGDVSAVSGGSKSVLNRIARRMTGRISGKLFRKLF